MPKLIQADGQAAAQYLHLDDEASLPQGQAVIVSLARWQAEQDNLAQHDAPVGVELPNTENVEELGDSLNSLPLIALRFPAFADGRAYSQARLLRERLNYEGDIRACGDVLRDQLFYMKRVGFSSFELAEHANGETAGEGLKDFSAVYQPTESSQGLTLAD